MNVLFDKQDREPVALVETNDLEEAVTLYIKHSGNWNRDYFLDLTGEEYMERKLYLEPDGFEFMQLPLIK